MFNNKKAEFEFNPVSAGFGILCGLITMIVMSRVEVGIFLKIIGFATGTIAGYFISAWRLGSGD